MTRRPCPDCGSKIAYKKNNGSAKCYKCGYEWKDKNSLDYMEEGIPRQEKSRGFMKQKHVMIIDEMRNDSRQSLTGLAGKTGVPLSSVFKGVHKLYKDNLILKNICLLDFAEMGFNCKVGLFLTSHQREELKGFIENHPNLNTLLRLSGDYDFYAEFVFSNMIEAEKLTDELKGMKTVKAMSVHFIEDVKREEFKIAATGESNAVH